MGRLQRPMQVRLTLVALVLVAAAANFASLGVAHTAGRGREMAVRAAVGATPGHLRRQIVSETVWLTALGGLVGLLVAAVGAAALDAVIPAPQTRCCSGTGAPGPRAR